MTITRPVNTLHIYTDNKEKIQDLISQNTGDKTSSLEVIGEYPVKQNRKHKSLQSGNSQHKSAVADSDSHKNLANKRIKTSQFDQYTIERIKSGLNQEAETIAIDLLGKPKVRGSNFLKFGQNHGSLSVTTKGEKQGWWHDFSDNVGGRGMLSFIQKYSGMDKRKALEHAAQKLGISPAQLQNKPLRVTKTIHKEKDEKKKLTEDQKKRIEFARKLAEQSEVIKGTLAEKYLKDHRAINLDSYPDDIRFHPGIYSKLNGKTFQQCSR